MLLLLSAGLLIGSALTLILRRNRESLLLAALCILRHRSNIQRLCRGEENRLGSKKKA